MNSTFSGHFGYRRLLRVTLPSIVMMIFTSIYCVTDGFFVSNFAGKAAFAAVLLLPLVLELDGIWLSIVFAETMAVLVTTVFLLAKRKKYGY